MVPFFVNVDICQLFLAVGGPFPLKRTLLKHIEGHKLHVISFQVVSYVIAKKCAESPQFKKYLVLILL